MSTATSGQESDDRLVEPGRPGVDHVGVAVRVCAALHEVKSYQSSPHRIAGPCAAYASIAPRRLALLAGRRRRSRVTERLKLERTPDHGHRGRQVFSPVCECPRARAASRSACARATALTVEILDSDGPIVRTLVGNRTRAGGPRVATPGTGATTPGASSPEGVYRPRVQLERARAHDRAAEPDPRRHDRARRSRSSACSRASSRPTATAGATGDRAYYAIDERARACCSSTAGSGC